MSNFQAINLGADGEEIIQNTSNIIDPSEIAGITVRDTSSEKYTLDVENDPERMLHQAEADELARRAHASEDFALELVNPATNAPYPGSEEVFAKRMAVASNLRAQGHYALDVGNQMMKARGGQAPANPAVAELQAQLIEQEEAREAARLAKIAARSR